MDKNIYNEIISELILRIDNSNQASLANARLTLSSDLGFDTVPENFNETGVSFTSTVQNMPTGYTVVPNSHVINYPGSTPSVENSSTTIIGQADVILGGVGSTFNVNSTVDITNGVDTITLTTSLNITAILPIFYGVKAAQIGSPTSLDLTPMTSESKKFHLVDTTVGRLYIVIPTATGGGDFKGIHDFNGIFIPADNFEQVTKNSHEYWVLKYDTQMTGNYNKEFLIVYNNTGGLIINDN